MSGVTPPPFTPSLSPARLLLPIDGDERGEARDCCFLDCRAPHRSFRLSPSRAWDEGPDQVAAGSLGNLQRLCPLAQPLNA